MYERTKGAIKVLKKTARKVLSSPRWERVFSAVRQAAQAAYWLSKVARSLGLI